MGHSVHTASFALPFVYMISEEGAAIANTKKKKWPWKVLPIRTLSDSFVPIPA